VVAALEVDPRQFFLDATPEQIAQVRRRFNPLVWAVEEARVRLAKGGQLDFQAHPFLRQVYLDTHPEIVVIKGAQLGFSTWAINRALWAVTTFPMTAIYTFPTRDQVSEFTASRINPTINDTPWLLSRIHDVDSVRLKKFSREPRVHGAPRQEGASLIYFQGASREAEAIAIDADLLVHDEEDKSDPQVIQQYEARIDHSKFKWRIRLSTPTYPGAGIDVQYKRSDMRRWLIKCPACNAWFELKFPRYEGDARANLEPEKWTDIEELGITPRYKCHRCQVTISNEDRSLGMWVALKTGAKAQGLSHGYSISQMAAPWVSAERLLWRKHTATWERDFWNLQMGRPWDDAANSITRAAVLERATGGPMRPSGRACFMGVDVGRNLDVVIDQYDEMGLPHTIRIARLSGWDELDAFMDLYQVACCVVDSQPEDHEARQFQDRHGTPGYRRVWRCAYRVFNKAAAYRETRWDDETGMVLVPREEHLTEYMNELLSKKVLPEFNGEPDYEAFILHHTNSKRRPIFQEGLEHDRVVDHYEWHEIGPDHFFHSGAYAMLARRSPRGAAPPLTGLVTMNRSATSQLIGATQARMDGDVLPVRVQRLG
jgi:hypothetical protein